MIVFWFLSALLTLGCADGPECDAETPCPFGSVCVESVCETNTCVTSAQCDMEQYCAEGVCTEGCSDDGDCYPGDACDLEAAVCEAEGCSDTHTDCAFNEFCNEISGECFEASGYYCQECGGDADCGGNGNTCYGGYCAVSCESDNDCPSAYTCIPFVDLAGNIQYFGCYTYCWMFEDGDYSDIESQDAMSSGVQEALPVHLALELPECLVVE